MPPITKRILNGMKNGPSLFELIPVHHERLAIPLIGNGCQRTESHL